MSTRKPVKIRKFYKDITKIDPDRVFENGRDISAFDPANPGNQISLKTGNSGTAYKDLTEILFIPDSVISGLEISISSLVATVTAGVYSLARQTRYTLLPQTVNVDAQDMTDSRYDVIYIDAAGVIGIVSGDLSLTPVQPLIPDGTLPIGTILITPTGTSFDDVSSGFIQNQISTVQTPGNYNISGKGVFTVTAGIPNSINASIQLINTVGGTLSSGQASPAIQTRGSSYDNSTSSAKTIDFFQSTQADGGGTVNGRYSIFTSVAGALPTEVYSIDIHGIVQLFGTLKTVASTASVAPAVITQGAAYTGTASGAIWNDGTHLYAYIDGAVRQLDQQTSNNIYTADGSLTADRTLTLNSHSLNFSGAGSWGINAFSTTAGSLAVSEGDIQIQVTNALNQRIGFELDLFGDGFNIYDEVLVAGMHYASDYSGQGIALYGNRWVSDIGYILSLSGGFLSGTLDNGSSTLGLNGNGVFWSDTDSSFSFSNTGFDYEGALTSITAATSFTLSRSQIFLQVNNTTNSHYSQLSLAKSASNDPTLYQFLDYAGNIQGIAFHNTDGAIALGVVSGIIVRDDIDSKGFIYNADYSAANASNPRWITDKAYVDSVAGGGGGSTGINGLNGTTNIGLGGPLGGDTTVYLNTNSFFFVDNADPTNLLSFQLSGAGGLNWQTTNTGDYISAINMVAGNLALVSLDIPTNNQVLINLGSSAGSLGYQDGASGLNSFINVSATGVLIQDDFLQVGLLYNADYSANGTGNPRWIADWGTIGSNFLSLAGGNLTGSLILFADPSSSMEAATKNYVDSFLSLSGGTLTGNLILAADPTSSMQATTKNYVDNLFAGIQFIEQAANVASTANVNISSAPSSLDGVAGVSGTSRWLLKNQSTASQNGVYLFNGTGSALTRTTDTSTGIQLANKTIPVSSGTTQADTWWTVTNDTITIGSTAITIVQTAGSGTYTNGTGITLTGNVFSIGSAAITNAMLAGSISNANLANSTISGIALGGTLANLTATDATLTFSGTYTGGTARSIGLNLGNANSWTAVQTITNTTGPQLTVAYDGTHNSTFSVSSAGTLTIGATAGISMGTATINSLIVATTTNNLYIPASAAITHTTMSQYGFNGSSTTGIRTGFYGSTSTSITASDNYAAVVFANAPVTVPSGTSNLANVVIKPIGTVSNSGTIPISASLWVDGAITTGTANWGIYSLANQGINIAGTGSSTALKGLQLSGSDIPTTGLVTLAPDLYFQGGYFSGGAAHTVAAVTRFVPTTGGGWNWNLYTSTDNGTPTATGFSVSNLGSLTASITNIGTAGTSVSGSTSGTALFKMPQQGTAWKVVIVYLNALLGTASYTFPAAFTNTPMIVSSNGLSTTKVTTLSTSTMTITGTTDTGYIMIAGF